MQFPILAFIVIPRPLFGRFSHIFSFAFTTLEKNSILAKSAQNSAKWKGERVIGDVIDATNEKEQQQPSFAIG